MKREVNILINIDLDGSPKLEIKGQNVCNCPECLSKIVVDVAKTLGLFLYEGIATIKKDDYRLNEDLSEQKETVNSFCMVLSETYFNLLKTKNGKSATAKQ